MHNITTVDATDTTLTRECSCGWLTIGEVPEPDHHTPLEQREAEHLREAAAIEDGTVWKEIPDGHAYRLHLRRRLHTGEPNEVVVTAVWTGGSREVLIWPWTAEGLGEAQGWCDKHHVTWTQTGYQVQPNSLANHTHHG